MPRLPIRALPSVIVDTEKVLREADGPLKSDTTEGLLRVERSHTFVPISWMCQKQTSVSHSSTESEIISLDAGLRLDGISALDL